MGQMKRYLERIQDDMDTFKDANEANEWIRQHGGYEYTPSSSTFMDKIKMGIENLYPRWLFRNYGSMIYRATANPNATDSELDAKKIVYPQEQNETETKTDA